MVIYQKSSKLYLLYKLNTMIFKKKSDFKSSLYTIFEEDESEAVTKEVIEDSTSNPITIFDLPLEILEKIFILLDGNSLLSLKKTNSCFDGYVSELLNGNKNIGWNFWRNISTFQIDRSILLKILSSFDNIIEEKRRLTSTKEHIRNKVNYRRTYTWENVFWAAHSYINTLISSRFQIKHLKEVESSIKNYYYLIYPPDPQKSHVPSRFSSMTGHIFWNCLYPPPNDFYLDTIEVYEELDKVKRTHQVGCLNETNIDFNFMTFSNYNLPSTNSRHDFLPKVERILIFSCSRCVNLINLMEGNSFQIRTPLEEGELPLHNEYVPKPQIAIKDNNLMILYGSSKIYSYLVSTDDGGNVNVNLLKEVQFSIPPIPYLPWFEYIGNGSWIYDIQKKNKNDLYDLDLDDSSFIGLQLISPLYGIYTFSDTNNKDVNNHPFINHNYPKYLEEHQLFEKIDVLESLVSLPWSVFKHGIYLFWGKKKIVLKYEEDIAFYITQSHWIMCNKDEINFVDILDKNNLIIAHPNKIQIANIKKITNPNPNGNNYDDITFEILRSINMNKSEIIKEITFEFENGIPYIFVVSDKNEDYKTFYDVVFKKIIFA